MIFNQFIDEIAATLPPIARDVWLVIFRHANQDGEAFITRSRIADSLNVSCVHVSHGIKILKAAGLIENNTGRYGYKLLSETVNDSLHPDSKQELTPQLTTVNTPVNHSLLGGKPQLTQYRIPLQNTLQNTSTEPPISPKKNKAKKTWQQTAGELGFWDWYNIYPEHRRFDARNAFSAWKRIMHGMGQDDREQIRDKIISHTNEGLHSIEWKEKNGTLVPAAVNYLTKGYYEKAFIKQKDAFGKEVDDDPDYDPFG